MSDAPHIGGGGKVAGLSIGGWAAVAAGGLAAAYFLRGRSSTASSSTTDATQWADTTQPGAGNLGIGYAASNPTSGQPTGDAATAPTTNSDWAVLAQRILFGYGYDPATVTATVQSWLAGNALTTSQQAMIGIALQKAGPAPEYVPPPPSGTPTGTVPIPTPPPSSGQSWWPSTRPVWEVHRSDGTVAAGGGGSPVVSSPTPVTGVGTPVWGKSS